MVVLAQGNGDVLLVAYNGATAGAGDVERCAAADCMGEDLTGEALDEVAEKDLAHRLQVKDIMGQNFGTTLERSVEVYANHLVAGRVYMRGKRKKGTEGWGWCHLQWCLESKNRYGSSRGGYPGW